MTAVKPITITELGTTEFSAFVLFTPDDVPPPSRAIVHSLSVFGDSAGFISDRADVFLLDPTFPPGFAIQHPKAWVASPVAPLPLDLYLGCGLVVPPQWALVFLTVGKRGDATLTIDWSPVQPSSGCIDTVAGLQGGGGGPPPAAAIAAARAAVTRGRSNP